MFTSTSQPGNGRNHYNYASSVERSTVQHFHHGWPSPSLSPESIHTPLLPPSSAPGQMYQSAFGRSDIGPHTPQEWNQWSGNANSDVLGLRSSTHASPMTNYNDMRVGSFTSPALNDLLYSTTNSPDYPGALDLPPMQPTRGYQMSPISSPSPSPSASSRKLSPSISPTPSSSRRGSVDSSTGGKKCSHCQATSTPLWRREPTTLKPLCNACGLYLQQRHRHRPKELIDADQEDDESEEEDQNYSGPECSHCHTHRTSVWRRSKTGAQLCNACGVYARLRGKDRPLSLKRKKIKPRTKHASTCSRSP